MTLNARFWAMLLLGVWLFVWGGTQAFDLSFREVGLFLAFVAVVGGSLWVWWAFRGTPNP